MYTYHFLSEVLTAPPLKVGLPSAAGTARKRSIDSQAAQTQAGQGKTCPRPENCPQGAPPAILLRQCFSTRSDLGPPGDT